MCNSSGGAAGSLSEGMAGPPSSRALSAVSMSRHRSGFGGVRRSASYTLWARKSFPTRLSISRSATNAATRSGVGSSDPEGVAEAALASPGDRHGARIGFALNPTQREAAIGQRFSECPADMQPPLAPVETRPTEYRAVFSGAEIDAELTEEALAFVGDGAAFGRQLDMAALGERVSERDAEPAREMVVAGPGGAHPRVARAGSDGTAGGGGAAAADRHLHDVLDHLRHRRRGEPMVMVPALAVHGEQPGGDQAAEMAARGLRRHPGDARQFARGQRPAVH